MPKLVVHGASLKCGEGAAPATLSVLPANATDSESHALATVDDYVPMVNIGTFGMCKTQANPQVAAATAAAQGVLTPMPCIPVTTSACLPVLQVHPSNGRACSLWTRRANANGVAPSR